MANKSKAPWCLGFVAALLVVGQVSAALIHIDVDTSSVSGDAVMYFDLTNGDLAVHHSVTISGFTTNGTLIDPPVLDPPGADITGTLPNPVSMSDSDDANFILTYIQNITLGTAIGFNFQIFGDPSPPGGAADGFLLSLFSSSGDPLLSDIGVLFRYSIGNPDPLEVFSNDVTAGVQESGVPEPGALALALAGLLALGLVRSVSNSPSQRTSTA